MRILHCGFKEPQLGAGTRNRTADLLITNQSLYRLSYSGMGWGGYDALVLCPMGQGASVLDRSGIEQRWGVRAAHEEFGIPVNLAFR